MAEPKVSIPISMRPRSTPNAELNAQNRERVVREITGETAPEVKDVPLRGYNIGGKVIRDWRSGKVISCRDC